MAKPSLEAVDFRYILLEHYKSLHIGEDELATLFLIDHLTRQGNDLVTADLLALKMNFKTGAIDKILVGLVKKGYLAYEVSGETMRTSLEPLKKKLYELFQQDMARDRANLMSADRAEMLARLYAYFEKRLNRTLSPLESDTINTWLNDAYTEEQIRAALEDALAAGKKTIKSVDKILRRGRKSSDIAAEGYSAVNDHWNADIAETIALARKKWDEENE